jgi:hypothetical protein
MWNQPRHGSTLHRALGHIRAVLLTALAMLSAGVAAASVSEWRDGNSEAGLLALAGGAFAAITGARAFWARGGTDEGAHAT